jgi:hypothetical protein
MSRPINIPMMATTTSSSTKLNARRDAGRETVIFIRMAPGVAPAWTWPESPNRMGHAPQH